MPAAAVIPAPIAYINVAAVKKLVVGSRVQACGSARADTACPDLPAGRPLVPLTGCLGRTGTFTLKKLECSKQAARLNNGAWNNRRGPWFYFVGFWNWR